VLKPLIDRLLGLPRATVPHPVALRDIAVPMPDGATLLADRYRPPGTQPLPVVLVRTPYGRRGLLGYLFGAVLARRGLQVLVQSTRGTFGSTGEFAPFHHERDDGLATVAWLRRQPWCDGRVAMAGASYLGHTQWAIGPYADPPLAAMCLGITASEFVSAFYPGGALALDDMLSWSAQIGTQEQRLAVLRGMLSRQRVRAALRVLPVGAADLAAIGARVRFLADVTGNAETPEFWAATDHSAAVAGLSTPTSMVTGWYDLFLPAQLRDFRVLRAAGRDTRITIGPWRHGDPASIRPMLADQVSFLAEQLKGDAANSRRAPVRVFLQRAGQWLDLAEWPPARSRPRPVHLRAGGRLADEPAGADEPGEPDGFRYDPADPTPSVGGPLLSGPAKQRDNRPIESRADVLVYTGEPLRQDLDVIGEPSATVHLRIEHEHADVFVRLCDVDQNGLSLNVTEGIVRLRPGLVQPDADGVRAVTIPLYPTAYRFRRGHRLRVQVSGGAFPRFSRNHGTGEPVATAVRSVTSRYEVFHDARNASALILPEHRAGGDILRS
jgi:putative CocE/NonD family hydrolase